MRKIGLLIIFAFLISSVYASIDVSSNVQFLTKGTNTTYRFGTNVTVDNITIDDTTLIVMNGTDSISLSSQLSNKAALNITINSFNNGSDIINASGNGNANFTIGGFTAQYVINVKKNNVQLARLGADATGSIKFSSDVTGGATFNITATPEILSVNLISPLDNALTNSQTFSCDVSSNSGIQSVTFFVGTVSTGVQSAIATQNFNGENNVRATFTPTLPDNSYTWNCMTTSSLGTTQFASVDRLVTIDTTPPQIDLVKPLPGNIYINDQYTGQNTDSTTTKILGDITLTTRVTDANVISRVSAVCGNSNIDDLKFDSISGTFKSLWASIDQLKNIPCNLIITARDGAGNTNSANVNLALATVPTSTAKIK